MDVDVPPVSEVQRFCSLGIVYEGGSKDLCFIGNTERYGLHFVSPQIYVLNSNDV